MFHTPILLPIVIHHQNNHFATVNSYSSTHSSSARRLFERILLSIKKQVESENVNYANLTHDKRNLLEFSATQKQGSNVFMYLLSLDRIHFSYSTAFLWSQASMLRKKNNKILQHLQYKYRFFNKIKKESELFNKQLLIIIFSYLLQSDEDVVEHIEVKSIIETSRKSCTIS